MENINLIDAMAVGIIFLSAVLAYFRGLAREILAIFSWIAAALLAFIVAPQVDPLINKMPIVKEILTDSCQLSILISFVISFIVSLVFLSLLIPMIANLVNQSSLNGLDRLLGLCFGILRGSIIIIGIFIGYEILFQEHENKKVINSAKTIEIISNVKEEFKTRMPQTLPDWIINRFDTLMETCENSTDDV